MKTTFLFAILLFASVACADNSGHDHKYPAGSPEWRNTLQKKVDQLQKERRSLLTVKNGEAYEDAERRYKRAEGVQRRIDKLSAMLADNSEKGSNSGRKPLPVSDTVSDGPEVDLSFLSNPDKPVAAARPVTDTAAPAPDPSERREKLLKKAERLNTERSELLAPLPGESKKQAFARSENAQRKLKKIRKLTSEIGD